MSQDLKEWLESFASQNVQIWCEDPETSTTSGVLTKTFLTYRILMKQVGRDIVGIRHRYSEFEALRTQLKDRYAPLGILIPSLPPKNSVTSIISSQSKDKSFIKERTLGLTMFCESIVASPWLKNDTQWKSFMKSTASGGSIEIENGASLGESKLIDCLSQLEIAYKYTMVQRMEDVKEEVLLIEKHVKSMLEKVRITQNCEKALMIANENVAFHLSLWLESERNGIRSLAGRAFDENESILKPTELVTSTLSAAASLMKVKCDNIDCSPEYTGVTLSTVLEQELALVESFKELFRMHEEILHSIDSVSSKLGKVEAGKAANKQEQLQELRKSLEEKQTCLTAFYKGFVYFSLPAAARQRALTVRKLSAAVAAAHLTCSFALQKSCLDFFKNLALSPGSAISSTCRMLELLAMRPLELLPEEVLNSVDSRGGDMAEFSGSVDVLFSRAISIGKGKAPAGSGLTHVSADLPPSAPSIGTTLVSPEKVNPLATRRGSAVMNTRSLVEQSVGQSTATGNSGEITCPPSESDVYEAPSAAMTLSSKTQSLLSDLTGDAEVEQAIGSAAPSNVWDEV